MLNFAIFCSGAVHKGYLHKIMKNWPPLVQKISTMAQSPSPPCPCGHTINFEKFDDFLQQKVRTSASE